MFPRMKLVLGKRKDGSLAYGSSALMHVLCGLAALAIAAIAAFVPDTIFPQAIWWILAFVLFLAALSRDSWIFSPSGLRRNFGFFPFPRHWDLPLDRISSLGLCRGKAGESPQALSDDRDRVMASLFGMGRGDWAALVVNLQDGRILTLTSGREKEANRLAAEGKSLAAVLGVAFKLPGEGEARSRSAD